ncbi:hypothetical protein [Paragemmobacter straminiformis]|uniref:Uncharacterized protein n=1 Tax=Paragemmobacter straminiformis TaxID=2045119 RepID=A0A842IB60_9RHOB|nr:hypothetical protein [Gemmobacter straminiformis]MBC2836587.1 hypothetical protein [Gemmobacter straminiformis]
MTGTALPVLSNDASAGCAANNRIGGRDALAGASPCSPRASSCTGATVLVIAGMPKTV